MQRFADNGIIALVGAAPRYDLAESVGPNLRLADLMADGLGDLVLGYGTAPGEPRLRRAIADRHGVDADDVVVTVGGMHALFLLAFVLCDRGDEAVVTAPLFPPARATLEAVGATLRTVRLSFDTGYRIDPAAVRAQLSPRTRLVSLASPQNPSGVAMARPVLAEILRDMAAMCPDARLLVDETYREAAFGNDPVASSALALGARVVSVASLSKCHGAPGLRIGWAITRDPGLRAQLTLAKFNNVVSCSAVDEALALRVLADADRILAERRGHLAAGRDRVARWIRTNSRVVEWVAPDAGAVCCVRLKPSVFDGAAVARVHAALAAADARVADGAWFGDDPHVIRLGFGLLPLPDLDTALARVTAALGQAVASDGLGATMGT